MGFDDAVKLGFSNYVNFSGRACRSEYWYWVLFGFIGGAACEGFDVRFGTNPIIAYIFFMVTFLPLVSVGIRRLHDLDRSGWWYLLFLIPLVGWIILIIWFCTKGTNGPNASARTGLLRRFAEEIAYGEGLVCRPAPRPVSQHEKSEFLRRPQGSRLGAGRWSRSPPFRLFTGEVPYNVTCVTSSIRRDSK
jgi:uncharacterized membrane protein YhaH (DUF805 family)